MNANQVADLVVAKLLGGWQGILFLIAVAVLAAGASYLGKYLETKGQNLATKEDFEMVRTQLSQSTALVEGIRAKISRTDWAAREWTALRIKKVEELMAAIVEEDIFMAQLESKCRSGTYTPAPKEKQTPSERMQTMCQLYFPELDGALREYLEYRQKIVVGSMVAWAHLRTVRPSQQSSVWEQMVESLEYEQLDASMGKLRQATADLLKHIVFEGHVEH